MRNLCKRSLIFFLFCAIYFNSTAQDTDPCIENTYSSRPVHIVILGSSTAAGIGTTPLNSGKSWAEKFTEYLSSKNLDSKVTNLAKGGFVLNKIMPTSHPYGDVPAPDPERNITKALSLKPDAIIIAMTSNDAANNNDVARQLSQFKEIIDSAKVKNVPVWVTTTQPRKFGGADFNKYAIQDKMQDTLRDIYGVYVIDYWTGLSRTNPKSPGSIFLTKEYYNKDSIHCNNDGHNLLYKRIMARDILTSLTVAEDKNIVVTQSASCGSPATIQVRESQPAIEYFLKKKDGSYIAGPITGDGNSKSFTAPSIGDYRIIARNNVLNCERELTSAISITSVDKNPAELKIVALQSFLITGTGTYVRVLNSEIGVEYKLKDISNKQYYTAKGNGNDLDLSTGTLKGSVEFVVTAENDGCISEMKNRVKVEVVDPENSHPEATITAPTGDLKYRIGQELYFSGTGVDMEDGELRKEAFSWEIKFFDGNDFKSKSFTTKGIKEGTFEVPHSNNALEGYYRIILTITDSKGAKSTTYKDIYPSKTTIKLNSKPDGLKLLFDKNELTTPYSTESIEGLERSIAAISPQSVDGKNFIFSHWQHGGEERQTIITPGKETTYTAVYIQEDEPSENGLNYSYYHGDWTSLPNFELLTPVKTGIAQNIDLSPRKRDDFFGLAFIGFIDIPATAEYTFYLKADEGSSLFLDSALVFDGSHAAGTLERKVDLHLYKGKHRLKLIYYEKDGDEVLLLSWSTKNSPKEPIPASALYLQNNDLPTGIPEVNPGLDKNGIRVFPNPAKDKGTVVVTAAKGEQINISIIDKTGKVITSKIEIAQETGLNHFALDLNLNNGTYIVKVENLKHSSYKHLIINQAK